MILFSIGNSYYNVKNLKEELHRLINKTAQLSANSLPTALWQFNYSYVKDFVASIFLYEDIVYVKVFSGNKIIVEKFKDAELHDKDYPFFKKSSQYLTKETQIKYNDLDIGTIQIVVTSEEIRKSVVNTILVNLLLLVIIVTAIIFVNYYMTNKFIFIPLSKLINASRRIADGNFDTVIETSAKDEIGQLAITFKKMMENIKRITASRDELDQEISERKLTEKALQETETRYRGIFENSKLGIAVYKAVNEGDDFTFIDLNKGAEKIENISREKLVGSSLLKMFPGVKKFGLFDVLQRVYKTGKSEKHPITIYSDNRIQGWRENFIYKLPTGEVIAIYSDETERKQMEEQIQHAQKMDAIGTLAGGIAHDFNNMLGVITGNASYILSNMNHGNEFYEVISDIDKGAKQAQALTQQLLTFSKGGAPIKKVTHINPLIKESSEFVLSGAKAKCRFQLSENLWAVEVDEGQINQVISNIVINANQAMPDGGIITIRTENTILGKDNILPIGEGRYIKISIEDSGIGISEKHLSKIFDPYFTTKDKGNGLGLASAYSIITKHGGHIEAYPLGKKGTVFNIYLPTSSRSVIEVKKVKQPIHAGKGSVLVMDDQEPILRMVGRMLNKMGYEAAFAIHGNQAIDMYQEAYESNNPFDIVILDITVPGGLGGASTMPELIKIDPQVKAIVSSGYSNDPIMANFKDYGFCAVVPKPYTKNELSEILNDILGNNVSQF